MQLIVQKENNSVLQSNVEENDSFRVKYELLLQENQLKDERIRNLLLDMEKMDAKFKTKVSQLEEKFEKSTSECQRLSEKVQDNYKVIDDMLTQMNHLRRKYMCAKSDLENEHKKIARAQVSNDMKIANLEEQNTKQKQKIFDLQTKLEAAIIEVKKNQNLAVTKCAMNDR